MFCVNCGKWIEKGRKRCQVCGAKAYEKKDATLFFAMNNREAMYIYPDLQALRSSDRYREWMDGLR